jgi:hypothetical protein
MKYFVFLAVLAVLALAPPAAAAKTDQERLARALEKRLSVIDKPGKGLCACMSDAIGPALKRVGVLTRVSMGQADTRNVGVQCLIPTFDANGARKPGQPSACTDWVPLPK